MDIFVFKAAGAAQLQAACDKLAPNKTGEAVITPGFALPAKFIIHAEMRCCSNMTSHCWEVEQNEKYQNRIFILWVVNCGSAIAAEHHLGTVAPYSQYIGGQRIVCAVH